MIDAARIHTFVDHDRAVSAVDREFSLCFSGAYWVDDWREGIGGVCQDLTHPAGRNKKGLAGLRVLSPHLSGRRVEN